MNKNIVKIADFLANFLVNNKKNPECEIVQESILDQNVYSEYLRGADQRSARRFYLISDVPYVLIGFIVTHCDNNGDDLSLNYTTTGITDIAHRLCFGHYC